MTKYSAPTPVTKAKIITTMLLISKMLAKNWSSTRSRNHRSRKIHLQKRQFKLRNCLKRLPKLLKKVHLCQSNLISFHLNKSCRRHWIKMIKAIMIRQTGATTTREAHINNHLHQSSITAISIKIIINSKLRTRATEKDRSMIEIEVQILVMLIITTTNTITIITTIVTIEETTTTFIKDRTLTSIITIVISSKAQLEAVVTEVDIEDVVIIIEEEAIDNITLTIINNNQADTIRIRLLRIIALAKKAVK